MIELTVEKRKELCERMPYLIPRNVWTGEVVEDYDYSHIRGEYELPEGWLKLFLQMCEDIREPLIKAGYLDKFRFSQIKEKYNRACFYNFGATEEIQNILRKYEHISQFVCQVCGKPAKYETSGWITSYCEDCIGNKKERSEEIEYNPTLHLSCYSKSAGEYDVYIDTSDIWNKLYEEDK